MKLFGSFKPDDVLISEEQMGNIHLKITKLSDLDDHPYQTIAVFIENDPSSSFERGDVIKKVNGRWVKIEEGLRQLGKPSNLRGYRIGSRAYIRWHDPLMVTDIQGKVLLEWNKCVLVKKNGSAPNSINDGTVLFTGTKRDMFNAPGTQAFLDYCPDIDNENSIVYRVFAVASNGSVSASDPIHLSQMTWSIIQSEIKNGNANTIFAPGDIFTLKDGNEIIVASIGTSVAPTQIQTSYPHLVTFMFRYGINNISFDAPTATGYKRTKDTYVLNKKSYYIKNGANYVRITPVIGSRIDDSLELYEAYSTVRRDYGSNNWGSSDIRAWMNALSLSDVSNIIPEWIAQNHVTTTPYQYLIDNDPGEPDWIKLANCIAQTSCKTQVPNSEGRGISLSSNRFFIPSITEIMGPTASAYDEGTQFQIYQDGYIDEIGLNYLDVSGNALGILNRSNIMTRSPYIAAGENGTNILTLHDGDIDHQTANVKAGCILAFSIG